MEAPDEERPGDLNPAAALGRLPTGAKVFLILSGALLPLAMLLRGGEGARALARFSRTIPFAIIPLIAAGIALAVVQVETPSLLLTTAYGRVLLVKLALVATLFLIAAVNRWRLTAPVEAGKPSATRRLVAG